MSNKETSTLQSVIDSASSTIQSAIGSITGNPADKQAAENKAQEAEARDTLSHATARAGPVTATPSGVAVDNADRSQGQWDQTMGSAKEFVGNVIGHEGLKKQGIEQNRQGQAQEAQGQLNDYGQGIKDRVGGTITGAVAGVTGDAAAQDAAQRQHDEGKARQRGVEAELEKKANA